ncbi:MAG: hypothetical protein AAFO29_10655, partial [Actinomycetota bacterium]
MEFGAPSAPLPIEPPGPDLVLRGGRIFDPTTGRDEATDLRTSGGVIVDGPEPSAVDGPESASDSEPTVVD